MTYCHLRAWGQLGVFLLLFSHPFSANATAGLAEWNAEFRYGDTHSITWHHGDICADAPGKNCFTINDAHSVRLLRVNIPSTEDDTLLLGQTVEGKWVVADLRNGEVLLETGMYPEILRWWLERGHSEPSMVSSSDPWVSLEETTPSSSMRSGRAVALFALLSAIGFFFVPFLSYLINIGFLSWAAVRLWHLYWRYREIKFLFLFFLSVTLLCIFGGLFLLPLLLIGAVSFL